MLLVIEDFDASKPSPPFQRRTRHVDATRLFLLTRYVQLRCSSGIPKQPQPF